MPFFLTQYLKSLPKNNWGKVTPLIYRSAQLNKRELVAVAREYELRINLNLRADLESEELAEIEAAGMIPKWVPMSDKRAPTPSEISQALQVLRVPLVKLVNCKGGRHRTGLVVACYRVTDQNWSKEQAWSEAEDFGFYSTFGHGDLKRWFEDEFKPEDYR